MELAFGIVMIILAAASALFVGGLFVWAAIKDGQDQHARDARVVHRRWPPDA